MNKQYCLLAAVADWVALQKLWRKSVDEAANQGAHQCLDDFMALRPAANQEDKVGLCATSTPLQALNASESPI